MWIEILLGVGLLVLYIYRYVTKSFDEFKKKGIPYIEGSFPFGSKNAKAAILGERNFMDIEKFEAYNDFKDPELQRRFYEDFGGGLLMLDP